MSFSRTQKESRVTNERKSVVCVRALEHIDEFSVQKFDIFHLLNIKMGHNK